MSTSFFPVPVFRRFPSASLIVAMLVFTASLIVVFAPEPPAILLTPRDGWLLDGKASSRLAVSAKANLDIPASAKANPEAVVFRTWTPDHGIVPIDLTSSSFDGERFLRVLITGNNRTLADQARAWLECETNGLRKEIFRGNVNNRLHAALVELPERWCSGKIVLRFQSDNSNSFVGVGSVFSASLLSYLKASFLGKIPFITVAAVLLVLLMLSGAALSVKFAQARLAFPAGLAFLGIVALGNFYFVSALPHSARWLGTVLVLALIGAIRRMVGRDTWAQAWAGLKPHLAVWLFGAGVFVAFSALVTNGLGAWEPNYRFWPATWSSDNELPWTYAEAIRRDSDLKMLWGGGWLPTDRTPLMAAMHLLYGGLFALMQFANDGRYLTSGYYNAASILLNALWLPVCHWMLLTFLPALDRRQRFGILLFVTLLPFSVFNTIYGWPKALGAAYALASFGLLAWSQDCVGCVCVGGGGGGGRTPWLLACALAALGYLSHGSGAFFLAPMLLFYAVWRGRQDISGLVQGFCVIILLLLTWSLYKMLILPSTDPLTKYALTGDLCFNASQSVWFMMKARYAELGVVGWLEIKKALLTQLFIPVNHTIAAFGLNNDFGAITLDRLRAWDFLMLSKGNIFLPATVVLGLVTALRGRALIRENAPFFALILCSLVALILVVSAFLAPVVLHQLPYAAIFGAALGGAVLLVRASPRIFEVLLLFLGGYTGAIWGFMPLVNALAVDVFAAAILVISLALGVQHLVRMSDTRNQE
jgi:hypothetical protein